MNDKIKSEKQINVIVKNLKKERKKIISLSGSFDILHSGHIKCLREAKQQGDILIVLLNGDKSVKMYKGPLRPIMSEKDRAEVISAIQYVDFIVIFNEINPLKVLFAIKPDIYCQARKWGRFCLEKPLIEKYGGKIHILKTESGQSSTNIIKRIAGIGSQPAAKAVFLDRDGTLNENRPGYPYKIEDFKFKKGALAGLKKLSKTSFKLVVVTNQSGIGRGYFSEKDLDKLHNWMTGFLKKKGARIDKIYYCPHHPDFDKKKCGCRKPEIGMLMKAVKDLGVSLDKSWLIGDGGHDILMGRRANLQTIFLGTNKSEFHKLGVFPHYFAKNFTDAVNIIIGKRGLVQK